ncbi:MAG: PQQ-binding-like beta-propeller repeat protein [Planctomyces sp.]|nr:PQQ-binding-like beta-propeller repeat protein [Planctomyces sp.]
MTNIRLNELKGISIRQPASLPLVLAAGVLFFLSSASAAAEDWPWFLGPRHTGVSSETDLQPDFSKGAPEVIWKQRVGTGYSAPSVLGEVLVIHHREGDEEIVSCRKVADGSEVWKYSYPTEYSDPYGYNNGPRCSPVLTATRCMTLGAEGMLTCVSMTDGSLIWQHELKKEFTLPEWFFGVGCSPILDGNRLIVLVGGQPNSGVVAFNVEDGKVLWQSVGRDTWQGTDTGRGSPFEWSDDEMVISYASPIISEIHGQRHLLCFVRQGLVSLDPETGAENFHFWFRPTVHESVNAAVPIVVDDTIFLSAAYQLGSVLLKVAPDGKSVSTVWRDRSNMLAHWSTPICVDGHIYGFTGRHENEGELRCIRLSDGKVIWKTDGYGGQLEDLARDRATGRIVETKTGKEVPYPFYGRGSLTQLGDRFVALGERGTLSVVKVNPEKYEELGRVTFNEIQYPAWTAPVISNGRMYLRSEDWLMCLNLRRQ